MRVMRYHSAPGASLLSEDEAPAPHPSAGEVRVQVYAAAVTPTELTWHPTTHRADGSARAGAIPGHEFSGRVEAIASGAEERWLGQEVFGMNDWFSEGATAEYCLTKPAWLAQKPQGLSHAEAAGVPISALTAWQGLFDRAKLRAGERVLVHGGGGAVGLFVVQLARHAGAHVISTASARSFALLRELGTDEIIDYHHERFEDRARAVDVVFDCVGGETLERSWSILGSGGRLVTIGAGSEAATDPRVKAAFFIVEPNGQLLAEIGSLLEAGQLRAFADAVVPFELAAAAYTGELKMDRAHGKVIIAVRPAA